MLIHSSKKKFQCGFVRRNLLKTDLKQSMLTYTIVKPHECNICKKIFSFKSCLNVQIRIHTEDKPFGCGVYYLRFIGSSSRNNHLQTQYQN